MGSSGDGISKWSNGEVVRKGGSAPWQWSMICAVCMESWRKRRYGSGCCRC
jgi:hypothetical protein